MKCLSIKLVKRLLTFLCASWLLCCVVARVSADIAPQVGMVLLSNNRIGLMGPSTNINQPNWIFYSGNDALEGAYMGWMFANVVQSTAKIPLPRTLPAGRYYVFVKGINYEDVPTPLTVAIGAGKTASVAANARDENRRWTALGAVTTTADSTSVDLTIQKYGVAKSTEKFLLTGLYITTDPEETVTREDLIIKLSYPTQMDESPAVKGNLITNGGFETGLDSNWGFRGYNMAAFLRQWDETVAYEGRASIRINCDPSNQTNPASDEALTSRVYRLKANKKYTFTFWAKVSAGKTGYVKVNFTNLFEPAPGAPAIPVMDTTFKLNDTWQRVKLSGYAISYPNSDYQFEISIPKLAGTDLWIDAVQLEEGEESPYQAAAPLEAGVMFAPEANLHYVDEQVIARLLIRNNTNNVLKKNVRYDVRDFQNRLVASGSIAEDVGANVTISRDLNLANGRTGIFRITTSVEGVANTTREMAYAVIFRPSTAGTPENSVMGIHPNYSDYQFTLLKRMGIYWLRAMSPAAFFRWSDIETTPGVYKLYTKELTAAYQKGLFTMGTLGTNDYWPASADEGGTPNLDKWARFVGDMLTQYKSVVKYWEIWNEPYAVARLHPTFTAAFYARMQKRAIDTIEAIDPTAQIVAMGGDPLDYVKAVIAEMEKQFLPGWNWRDHIRILSTHNYPKGQWPQPFEPDIINKYGTNVWNTETGTWDKGFYVGNQSNFMSWGDNLWPQQDADRYYRGTSAGVETLVTNFLECIGSGLKKYFYYDSRYMASPSYILQHPTMLEYDGTIRAKGIAYSIAGSFVDYSTSQGNVSPNSAIYAYLFDRGGTPTLAAWTRDRSIKTITAASTMGSIKAFDVMGNQFPASPANIPIGPLPVYVVGTPGMTAQIKQAILKSTITARVDDTPPTIIITEAPDGVVTERAFRFRWFAIDETSLPGLGMPEADASNPGNVPSPLALLYSYQLVGSTYGWSDWSAGTLTTFTDLPSGAYTFEVRSKDEAGNVSAIERRPVTVNGLISAFRFHPADEDLNQSISIEEATRAAYCWKSVISSGCPAGLDLNTTVRAGVLWRTGSLYIFDPNQSCPGCWSAP